MLGETRQHRVDVHRFHVSIVVIVRAITG